MCDIGVYLCSSIFPFEKNILTSEIYRSKKAQYKIENNHLCKNKKYIIFLGDSHIYGLINYISFTDKLVNRGIKGDTTVGIMNRIDENINALKVEKIFLLIGYNDLKFRTDEKIVANIARIISLLNADHIYVFSLLPVHRARFWFNHRIVEINKQIQKLCEVNEAEFINIYSPMLTSEKKIAHNLTTDGTHLSAEYYKKWISVINRYLY